MLETSSHNSLNSHLFWSLIFEWFSGRFFWTKTSSSAWTLPSPENYRFRYPSCKHPSYRPCVAPWA
jgi:hypothetical protein